MINILDVPDISGTNSVRIHSAINPAGLEDKQTIYIPKLPQYAELRVIPASSTQGKCAKEWLVLSSTFDTEVGWLDYSRRASFPGTIVALLIFDVERLYL